MRRLKITILCENTVGRLVGTGEHGFSAFVETEQGNYLFDTGNGHSIVSNSLVLGKDLRSIQKIFLSHGHPDHTEGFRGPQAEGNVDVHAHPHLFSDRIAVLKEKDKETKRFVGVLYKRAYLEILGARFLLNSDFAGIDQDMYLTGEVPRKTGFENRTRGFSWRSTGDVSPTPFRMTSPSF